MNPKPLLAALLPLAILGGIAAQDQKPRGDGEKITLRVTAPKDRTIWFKTRSEMSRSVTTPKGKEQSNIQTELVISARSLGTTEDGSTNVAITVVAARGRMELPTGLVTFDSTGGETDEYGIGKAFSALVGRTMTAVVAPHGKLVKLEGAAEAAAAATSEAVPMSPGAVVRALISEASLRLGVQRLFGRLPKGELVLGQTWDGEHEAPNARSPVETKSKLTLAKVTADQAEITMAGTLTKAPGGDEGKGEAASHEEQVAQKIMQSMKVDGALKGRFVLSRQDGLVLESAEEVAVTIKAETPDGAIGQQQSNKATLERTTEDAAKPRAKEAKPDGK